MFIITQYLHFCSVPMYKHDNVFQHCLSCSLFMSSSCIRVRCIQFYYYFVLHNKVAGGGVAHMLSSTHMELLPCSIWADKSCCTAS